LVFLDLKEDILIYEKKVTIFIIQNTICTNRIIWEKFFAFIFVDISLSFHKLGAFPFMKKKTRLKILGMYSIVSSAVKILAIISSSLSTVVSKMRFLRWPQRRGTGDNFGNQETLRKHELCLKLPHLTPHTASFKETSFTPCLQATMPTILYVPCRCSKDYLYYVLNKEMNINQI